jgi:large subunit ribosomal protein L25
MLKAITRTLQGRKTSALREEKKIPAVVYGAGREPKNIEVDYQDFVRTYRETGESSLLDLEVDGKETVKVLIQDLQHGVLHNEVTHVDFRAIDLSKPIEVDVEIRFIGESPAVKGLGGTLVRAKETVAVRCLPSRLPSSLEVDLSLLKTFEDSITVGQLVVGEGVEILDDVHAAVAVVTPPRSDEELAKLDEAVSEDVTKVESAKKEKPEEETEAEEKKEA